MHHKAPKNFSVHYVSFCHCSCMSCMFTQFIYFKLWHCFIEPSNHSHCSSYISMPQLPSPYVCHCWSLHPYTSFHPPAYLHDHWSHILASHFPFWTATVITLVFLQFIHSPQLLSLLFITHRLLCSHSADSAITTMSSTKGVLPYPLWTASFCHRLSLYLPPSILSMNALKRHRDRVQIF